VKTIELEQYKEPEVYYTVRYKLSNSDIGWCTEPTGYENAKGRYEAMVDDDGYKDVILVKETTTYEVVK
jgi:hypothetical protein